MNAIYKFELHCTESIVADIDLDRILSVRVLKDIRNRAIAVQIECSFRYKLLVIQIYSSQEKWDRDVDLVQKAVDGLVLAWQQRKLQADTLPRRGAATIPEIRVGDKLVISYDSFLSEQARLAIKNLFSGYEVIVLDGGIKVAAVLRKSTDTPSLFEMMT